LTITPAVGELGAGKMALMGAPAKDLSNIFSDICERRGVRVNKQITALLSGRTELRIEELDLRKVYLAPKAVVAVVELLGLCSNLRSINVSSAQLDNDGAVQIAEALREHPGVTAVDMSSNDISLPAGKALLKLLTDNPNVVSVNVDNTSVSSIWAERLNVQAELNASKEGPSKDLSCDDGTIDGGVGRPAQRARRDLGLGPSQGVDDEEWEWDSNVPDQEGWEAAMKRVEEEMADDAFRSGAEPAYLTDAAHERSDPPAFEPAERRVLQADTQQSLNTPALQHQDLDEITASLFDSTEKWTDPLFPPCDESLVSTASRAERVKRCRGIQWARVGEVVPSARLFVAPQRPSLPVAGALNDRWLAYAAASVCSKNPEMITALFSRAHPDIGAYQVRIHKNGSWFEVVIDDYLPVDESGTLIYMTNSNPNEVWASLLEKAWAKFHGGYDRLERGSSTLALSDLTGGVAHSVRIRSHKRAKEVVADSSYWDAVRGYMLEGWLLAAAAKAESGVAQASLGEQGIRSNVLHPVIEMVEVTRWKLIQLLVPGESDEGDDEHSAWLSPQWVEWLPDAEHRELLRHHVRPRQHPGGLLRWMTFENFAILFDKLHVCRVYSAPSLRTRHVQQRAIGEWKGNSAGGRLRERYFTENPCYALRVKEKNTPVLIHLAQKDARLARGTEETGYKHKIGLYVVRHTRHDRKKRIWIRDDVVVPARFVAHRETCVEVLCQPLVNYLITPCTEQPGVETAFGLQCFAPAPFSLTEVPSHKDVELTCSGRWRGATAGGRPQGSSKWMDNPQFCLEVKSAGLFGISLHQEVAEAGPRYIAFYLFRDSGGRRVETYNSADVVLSVDFGPYKTAFAEGELEAGDYTVIAMTWAQGEEADFSLSVFTQERAKLTPIRSLVEPREP